MKENITEREKIMKDYIEYLLDYARRISQRQIVSDDLIKLKEIRSFLKDLKDE